MKDEKVDAVKFSVYFHRDQVEYMDKEAEKLGVTLGKYMEMKCLPKSMWRLSTKKRKGAK